MILQVAYKEAEEWCKKNSTNNNILYFETSVKANINVDEAFINLTRGILERDKDNQKYMPNQITLNNEIYNVNNSASSSSKYSFTRFC